MRPNRDSIRHRALKIAFAVSWASSIQFAGCLNSPFRSDLAEEARKAARRAEASEMIAEEEDQVSSSSGIQLAGGETPVDHRGVTRVSGTKTETETRKVPAWKFWVKDKAEDQDKKSAETKTAPKSSKPGTSPAVVAKKPATTPSSTGKVAQKEPSKSAAELQKAEALKKSVSPESWFEKELAAKESRLPDAPEFKVPITEVKDKAASSPATQNDSTAELASDTSGFRPFPAAEEKKVTAKTDHATSTSGTPEWAAVPAASLPASATTTDFPSSSFAPPSTTAALQPSSSTRGTSLGGSGSFSAERSAIGLSESTTQRQQRLRVNAMLSEAHSCLIRGEVHAAYRSALIAERIATEHHLEFSGEEENPREFAREIAARLWKTNKSDESTVAESAASGSFELASGAGDLGRATQAHVAAPSSSPFDSSFGDSFARWTPAPNDGSVFGTTSVPSAASKASAFDVGLPAGTVANAPPAKDQFDSWPGETMPQIRPSAVSHDFSRTAPGSKPVPVGNTGSQAQPSAFASREMELSPGRVEFAIAHAVKKDAQPRAFQTAEGSFSELSTERTAEGFASAAINIQRPLLQAPAVPERTSAGGQDRPWDENLLAQGDNFAPEMTDPDAVPVRKSSSRLLWVIFGFLGAGVATVLGLKFSRKENSEQDTAGDLFSSFEHAEAAASTAASVNAEENVGLRIKRAA